MGDELEAWAERVAATYAERIEACHTDAERARWPEVVDGRLEHLALVLAGRPNLS